MSANRVRIISIIGSTGQQGSALIKALCKIDNNNHIKIHAITRDVTNGRNKLKHLTAKYPNKIEFISGDYADASAMNIALRNSWAVFVNFGQLIGVPEEKNYAINIVNAAIINNAKYIMFSGITKISNEFSNPLENLKNDMEQYFKSQCKKYVIDFTVLRPSTFMQNFFSYHQIDFNTNTCRSFWKKDVPLFWISTEDIGKVAAELFMKKLQTNDNINDEYYVYSDLKTMDECIKIISNVLKRKLTYSYIDVDEQDQILKNCDIGLKNLIFMFRDYNNYGYDILKDKLGYLNRVQATKEICDALTDFETFVIRNIDALMSKDALKSKL